jgi:diketogulonate reductase-like aldo/keto reductase
VFSQVEVHPIWRNDELIAYCRDQNIHVSAYCPLGTPWTSAKAVIRRANPASQHPVINEIAKKYKKHVLHIIMRWGLQHGTSILAKSSNPGRIKVCPHLLSPPSLLPLTSYLDCPWDTLTM